MIGLPMVTVVGTLTADFELRFTPAGVAVGSATIAANDRRYNKSTQSFEDGEATFLRVSIWRQAAENAAELTRGTRVIAVGVLKQRSFDDRDGNKRTVIEMEAEELGASTKFAVVTSRKAPGSAGGSETGGDRQPAYSGGSAEDPWANTSTANEADIPF